MPVLDVAGFLSKGQVQRLTEQVQALERDTGVKLRVLAQAYPQTPGLAVRDYWGVDANTVVSSPAALGQIKPLLPRADPPPTTTQVFVADPNTGNILNFNVGANLDLQVPPNFWTRLANKYGVKKYWQNNGCVMTRRMQLVQPS